MRPQGSPAELERRRLRAIELLQRDVAVHVVADRVGVDRRSVRRWKRVYRRHGREGLRARPASGRPPKLSAAQRRRLARLVVAGPGSGRLSHQLVDVSAHRRPDPASLRCRLPSGSRGAPDSRLWLQPAATPTAREGAQRSSGARVDPRGLGHGKKHFAGSAPISSASMKLGS